MAAARRRRGRQSLATATGSIARPAAGRRRARAIGDRLGGRLVGSRGGWLASFGLGAIFAIGWTPCIGIILGGILTLAATSRHGRPGRAPARRLHARPRAAVPRRSRSSTTGRRRSSRPLVRHGRAVSLIGGLLVVAIGVAMVFDWLRAAAALLPVQHGDLSDRERARVHATDRERHGLIGPFSGRQLAGGVRGSSWSSRSSLVGVDHAARQHRDRPGPVDPRATAVPHRRRRRPRACRPGSHGARARRRRSATAATYQLTDLDGKPIRLADLRGKAVWLNFWATLVPAVPVGDADPARRSPSATATAGLELVGDQRPGDDRRPTSRPTPTATSSATRSASTASGDIFHAYKVFALPTQFFIDTERRHPAGRRAARSTSRARRR